VGTSQFCCPDSCFSRHFSQTSRRVPSIIEHRLSFAVSQIDCCYTLGRKTAVRLGRESFVEESVE
jgi:hypothetical protein